MKTSRRPAKIVAALAALLAAGSLVGCEAAVYALEIMDAESGSATRAPDLVDSASVARALVQLEGIPVKGRAPKTGYSRDEFVPAWADVDRNGCDTRNDILARDLIDETFRPGTNKCVVTTGLLTDKLPPGWSWAGLLTG